MTWRASAGLNASGTRRQSCTAIGLDIAKPASAGYWSLRGPAGVHAATIGFGNTPATRRRRGASCFDLAQIVLARSRRARAQRHGHSRALLGVVALSAPIYWPAVVWVVVGAAAVLVFSRRDDNAILYNPAVCVSMLGVFVFSVGSAIAIALGAADPTWWTAAIAGLIVSLIHALYFVVRLF